MYRIIETDNHGGDYPNESFVNVPAVFEREQAQGIADAINAAHCRGDSSPRFWRVVPADYTLQPGFEP